MRDVGLAAPLDASPAANPEGSRPFRFTAVGRRLRGARASLPPLFFAASRACCRATRGEVDATPDSFGVSPPLVWSVVVVCSVTSASYLCP
ncbi:hypothetical protein [Streptomyces sp. NPDC047453]|uniref:hypothetical protein n=1 Tax=Streptomyces sp. NPDC047453 TaxID=3154812 RepID=UPI0033F3CAC4